MSSKKYEETDAYANFQEYLVDPEISVFHKNKKLGSIAKKTLIKVENATVTFTISYNENELMELLKHYKRFLGKSLVTVFNGSDIVLHQKEPEYIELPEPVLLPISINVHYPTPMEPKYETKIINVKVESHLLAPPLLVEKRKLKNIVNPFITYSLPVFEYLDVSLALAMNQASLKTVTYSSKKGIEIFMTQPESLPIEVAFVNGEASSHTLTKIREYLPFNKVKILLAKIKENPTQMYELSSNEKAELEQLMELPNTVEIVTLGKPENKSLLRIFLNEKENVSISDLEASEQSTPKIRPLSDLEIAWNNWKKPVVIVDKKPAPTPKILDPYWLD